MINDIFENLLPAIIATHVDAGGSLSYDGGRRENTCNVSSRDEDTNDAGDIDDIGGSHAAAD